MKYVRGEARFTIINDRALHWHNPIAMGGYSPHFVVETVI